MLPTSDWSYERLVQLAPDGQALEQARRLFFSRRWTTLAGNGEWLWGESETTSGGLSVRTAVNLPRALFHCTCRGPRRPCRHGLALVLFLLRDQERLSVQEPPEWVLRWAETARPRAETPDAAAVAARRTERLEQMDDGVAELQRWLIDFLHQGLAGADSRQEDMQHFAARMVDYKLPGPARRLRALATAQGQDDWHRTLLEELAQLYFFTRAWQQREQLSETRQRELLLAAGVSIRREEALSEPPVNDHWLVLGIVEGEEEALRYRRTYLRGESTGRMALLLDFAHGQQPMAQQWPTGSAWLGEVYFFPGNEPLRALFPQPQPSRRPYDNLRGLPSFSMLTDQFATTLGRQPWLVALPVLLDDVRPDVQGEEAFLWDHTGQGLPFSLAGDAAWTLLALSGGRPLSVFGEWNGRMFQPLSAIAEGRVTALA